MRRVDVDNGVGERRRREEEERGVGERRRRRRVNEES